MPPKKPNKVGRTKTGARHIIRSKSKLKPEPVTAAVECPHCGKNHIVFPAKLLRAVTQTKKLSLASKVNGRKGGRPKGSKDSYKRVVSTVVAVVALFFILLAPARAEDWEVGGRTLHNVIVTQVDPDRVQITYDGGVGAPDLVTLSPELQKRFNFDPVKAKEAKDAREKLAADERAALAQINSHTPPPAPVVVTTSPPTPVVVVDTAAIRARINQLEDEIDQLSRTSAKPGHGTRGAYADMISNDEHEVADLRRQLTNAERSK